MNRTDHNYNNEKQAVASLAAIFACRMIGLFMIIPIFSLYAQSLSGATHFLIGIALGIYGLTQALLQIPFGFLSDKYGRKPIIAFGLILFALGSLICAESTNVYWMIVGRALQGTGAIGSTLIAFVADLTREENRTKAMAVIGMVIGLSFSVAMVLGSLLSAWFSIHAVFWLSLVLALFGLIILALWVPKPVQCIHHTDSQPVLSLFKKVLSHPELLRLDIGIFCQHAILTAVFIAIPIALKNVVGLPASQQWLLYLPVMALSFFLMLPFILIAEKKRQMKLVFVFAITAIAVSQFLFVNLPFALWSIGLALLVFFTAFNCLEAALPSLISKIAPAGSKGTALGVYSCAQFLGIFFGGAAGGWLYQHYHFLGVFYGCLMLALIWLLLASTMQKPKHLTTQILSISIDNQEQAGKLAKQLATVLGVEDVSISVAEQVAYLKVDKTLLNETELTQFAK